MTALLQVGLAFVCNFASGPATVLSNKLVFTFAAFRFPITLTIWHYLFTWCTVRLLALAGTYEPTSLRLLSSSKSGSPARAVGCLIVVWSMYNISSNASLSQNSVGMYQMVKLLMTPLAVVWDYSLYGRKPTAWQALLLAMAIFGISQCTVSGFQNGEVSRLGLGVALLSTLFAVVQKGLTTHVVQYTSVKLSPLQLLDYSMPWMGMITLLSALALEDMTEVVMYQPTSSRCLAILASSFCGMLANVSSTWVLGLTSPIAHILLGQLKTVCVLLGGYFFFDSKPRLRTLLGAALTLVAITLYAFSKATKNDKEAYRPPADCVGSEDAESALKEDDMGRPNSFKKPGTNFGNCSTEEP
mmetsp:Transcript_3106/g.7209  ORF Transcript_3106/g.7209 Transcript_3106/m.7209 type:complete len:357 (-) Transcript_3106:169-1239(-)